MVKVIYSYQCEICHTVYDTEELAVSCNADSVPEPKYEKGIQYTDMQNKSWKVEEIQISSVQVGPKKRRHTIIYISRNENGNKETITEKKLEVTLWWNQNTTVIKKEIHISHLTTPLHISLIRSPLLGKPYVAIPIRVIPSVEIKFSYDKHAEYSAKSSKKFEWKDVIEYILRVMLKRIGTLSTEIQDSILDTIRTTLIEFNNEEVSAGRAPFFKE